MLFARVQAEIGGVVIPEIEKAFILLFQDELPAAPPQEEAALFPREGFVIHDPWKRFMQLTFETIVQFPERRGEQLVLPAEAFHRCMLR